jgi:hypothetical protein
MTVQDPYQLFMYKPTTTAEKLTFGKKGPLKFLISHLVLVLNLYTMDHV